MLNIVTFVSRDLTVNIMFYKKIKNLCLAQVKLFFFFSVNCSLHLRRFFHSKIKPKTGFDLLSFSE